jgi:hypothetical protein
VLIDINILMLGVAHQGTAFPIVWMTPSKAGGYSTDEQITLMEIFIDLFDKERIKSLSGHFGIEQANSLWQMIISV